MVPAINSGPPSEESSPAMPKVTNTLRSAAISHFGALCILFYHWPIRVSINGDEVIVTDVAEVVSSYCL